jgi:voltage-gated potassium channel Kch
MIINRFKIFLRKFDNILLLISLVLLVASPIWAKVFKAGWMLSDVMTIVIIISGLSVTYSHHASRLNLKNYFGILTVVLSVIDFVFGVGESFSAWIMYFQVIYFLVLTVVLFNLIIKSNKVDSGVVISSISGYLLMGLSWAIIINIWIGSFPEAFSFTDLDGRNFFNSIYFAFVTMTTLGYGDMLPLSQSAKAISILIAITGAFYSTIVLGMIVGKYISNESINRLNKD